MAKFFYELKQNKNEDSKVYGKWFAYGKTVETLNTRKLAQHIAEHGSIYTPDVVYGVLEKFRSCLVEMLLESKRVKIDGLGIFYCTIDDNQHIKIKDRPQHASWLRIYATKLEPGCYIITGGAIKLTRTMQEREHTLKELNKMEQVRNYLISNQAIDADGFVDFLSELK